jgi:hypothetical protein
MQLAMQPLNKSSVKSSYLACEDRVTDGKNSQKLMHAVLCVVCTPTEYGFFKLALVILMVMLVHFVEAYMLNPAIYSAHLKLHPLLVSTLWFLPLLVSMMNLEFSCVGCDKNDDGGEDGAAAMFGSSLSTVIGLQPVLQTTYVQYWGMCFEVLNEP